MERQELIEELKRQADAKYRDFHLGTCPKAHDVLGVRLPIQRKLAKQIVHGDFRRFLMDTKNEFYEETMIEGLVIMSAPITMTERIGYLRQFVLKIDNWAICDSVCNTLRLQESDRDELWQYLCEYQKSMAEFELRFMVVMMMNYFLQTNYFDQVLEIINRIKSQDYYVEMAIAWLIAEALVNSWTKTLEFLKNSQLSDFAYNKALQKARESYRITPEQKVILQKMKRK